MALGSFSAGPYTSTYNALATGQAERGYELSLETMWENIQESDAYARTLQDGVYQGANCSIQYTCIEWRPGSLAAYWPWGGGTLGQFINSAVPIGSLASTLAKAMILTVVPNTPASVLSPIATSLTASQAILAPQYPAALLFNSALRKVPVRLQLLPSNVAGTVSHFTYA